MIIYQAFMVQFKRDERFGPNSWAYHSVAEHAKREDAEAICQRIRDEEQTEARVVTITWTVDDEG
jgi:hypothetical protein